MVVIVALNLFMLLKLFIVVRINSMNIISIINEEIKLSDKSSDLNKELSFLNEGLSKILYHFTYISNLISILKYNKFATSSNLGSNADAKNDKGKFFFFSTQRTKGMAGYGSRHGTVAIVLNGEKLNQNFKGFPTDYWNWSKKRSDYKDINTYIDVLKSSELEDRIVTDKPYIDNASNYIMEIHIEASNDHRDLINKDDVDEIVNLCNKHNIPVYFYTDENNFKLQNKAKAVSPENLNVEVKEKNDWDVSSGERELYDMKWLFKKIAPIIIVGNDDITDSHNSERNKIESLLKAGLEKYNSSDQYDNIMSDINTEVRQLSTSWGRIYGDDKFYSMQAEIHNKRGDPNPYYRELLKLLINDMKKWKVGNIKDYFNKKLKLNLK